MEHTLSVIKADIGLIGGHIQPSRRLLEAVRQYVREKGKGLLQDVYISHTGDDIAILMTHHFGVGDPQIHKLACSLRCGRNAGPQCCDRIGAEAYA